MFICWFLLAGSAGTNLCGSVYGSRSMWIGRGYVLRTCAVLRVVSRAGESSSESLMWSGSVVQNGPNLKTEFFLDEFS